jgi:cell division septum initiation protein DivIVA
MAKKYRRHYRGGNFPDQAVPVPQQQFVAPPTVVQPTKQIGDISRQAQERTRQLTAQAQETASNVARQAQQTTTDLARQAQDTASDVARQTQETASNVARQAQETAKKATDTVTGWLRGFGIGGKRRKYRAKYSTRKRSRRSDKKTRRNKKTRRH